MFFNLKKHKKMFLHLWFSVRHVTSLGPMVSKHTVMRYNQ